MPFIVPELSYKYDALEPYIDAETMRLHHDKHHSTYVSNLNKALEGGEYASWSLDTLVRDWSKLPETLKTIVRNNAGGHYNHSLLWSTIGPTGGGRPTGSLGEAIEKEFGGLEALKKDLTAAALGRFGSGWAWLSVNPLRKLTVSSTANQDSPLSEGSFPLLGIDVWEHAYYLRYQNRRTDYLEAFFNIVDWAKVATRYGKPEL
jgi:superoxide dismutase, Fe-Mn family